MREMIMKRRHWRYLFKVHNKMYTGPAQVLKCLKVFEEGYNLKGLD